MSGDINWKIGGQAGYGIMSTGKMFAKVCLRHGWQVFCYTEYPSLIRGGHNTYQVHSNKLAIHSQKRAIDVLIALDELTIKENISELAEGGVAVYDPDKVKLQPPTSKNQISSNQQIPIFQIFEIPLSKISQEICGSELMRDTVALGASLALYRGELNILSDLIKEEFKNKGETVIKQNIEAAKQGYELIFNPQSPISKKFSTPNLQFPKLDKVKGEARILVTGNEAMGLGALAAGCKFYVAYPMTPASSILHFLAKHERNYDLLVKQAEDEIAVINMAIGASFAGVRSMCATSGGGFALMNESLGFAGMAEIPLVVVLAQRTAPATGLPTWTGQADLMYAIHASHGEFLRVVIAPGDAEEAYEAAVSAFNLAEKYQLPVIVLSDKYLSESPQSVNVFSAKNVTINRGAILTQKELDKIKDYKRYEFIQSGISPRSLPGMKGGEHQANSDEHDEYGFSTENAATRNMMMEKRTAKLPFLIKELPDPKIYGNQNAAKTIICWGSTKMPALEALKNLPNTRVVHLQYLLPFPAPFFKKNIKPEQSIIIEGNQTGQLQQLIKQQTGMSITNTLLKYDGRPFYPEEIIDKIRNSKSEIRNKFK